MEHLAIEIFRVERRKVGVRETAKGRDENVAGSRLLFASLDVLDFESPKTGLTRVARFRDEMVESDVVDIKFALNTVHVIQDVRLCGPLVRHIHGRRKLGIRRRLSTQNRATDCEAAPSSPNTSRVREGYHKQLQGTGCGSKFHRCRETSRIQ